MGLFCRKRFSYLVTLECSGRHPYRHDHDLDYFEGTKEIEVRVVARDWEHAAMEGLSVGPGLKCWSWSVKRIEFP